MLQFGASLTDDTSSVIYDRNMFIIQATGVGFNTSFLGEYLSDQSCYHLGNCSIDFISPSLSYYETKISEIQKEAKMLH